MPKKRLISLSDIKVQSFITGIDSEIAKKMQGGTDGDKTSMPITYCCATPQTACGPSSPCHTNCSPPPEAC